QVEVTSLRQMALDAFRRHGLPDHSIEWWKLTRLTGQTEQTGSIPANEGGTDAALLQAVSLGIETFLLGLVNGRLDPDVSKLTGLEKQSWGIPANEGGIDAALLQAVSLGIETYRLVFVNGRLDPAVSKLAGLPDGVVIEALSQSQDVADALGDVVEARDTVLG